MRVHGRSTSFGSGGEQRGRERSERFRKAHKPGQKVRGTVVEWQGEGLAWVEIDGHRLLAQVSPDSRLGRERGFLIVSLAPDIVLRELPARTSGLDVVV
ncbi:hypothetical protein NNJEOMEG_03570 [Fundidesulfovibrio magnetotacticus]|uniref:S1 motif domain-containing protein n=1 Tax=Fundidesulfovibrio magnetotacticus TaxID=2730080 RepID=A0A6V8LTA7_9BACT|nr:hypothetical protein [Fundidesulfovibrio magnetotacticus]GFK95702.1 hypothetical protein NNJEOMEG_03570 [Fundidesulfovibrio magnetotacticus]